MQQMEIDSFVFPKGNEKFTCDNALSSYNESEKQLEFKRKKIKHEPIESGTRFMVQKKNFANQYSHIYFYRLQHLKPVVKKRAEKQWIKGNTSTRPIMVDKILDLPLNMPAIIVGTLYKNMKLKPNILTDYAKDRLILPIPHNNTYVDETDTLILEDETGRIDLIFDETIDINVDNLITGMVISVKGKMVEGTHFQVEDICFPGFAPQDPLPQVSSNDNRDRYALLVSGLNIGNDSTNPLALQLLCDYITGDCGSAKEANLQVLLSRVIIAGESILNSNYYSQKVQSIEEIVEPIKDFDTFLAQICAKVNVDLMPGSTESNFTLPQQPFNKCLFPKTNKYSSLNTVTNPYEVSIEGRLILGSSGQTVDDVHKYLTMDKLDIAEQSLNWRHMAVTCPDTLPCYPFYEQDPFILEKTPHVYFIGNQDTFESKRVTGTNGEETQIIMIPSYSKTSTVLLLNLDNLNITPLKLDADLNS